MALKNGALEFSLFSSDGYYLIAKGSLKLGKSIQKAIDSFIPILCITNPY